MTVALTEKHPGRRDKLVILAEIIQIAKNGTSKTHIMIEANLSFSQLNGCLMLLTQTGLLEKSWFSGREIYRPTQKGWEFMRKQCEVISILNEGITKNRVKTYLPIEAQCQKLNF